jgi:hypothetical protein
MVRTALAVADPDGQQRQQLLIQIASVLRQPLRWISKKR